MVKYEASRSDHGPVMNTYIPPPLSTDKKRLADLSDGYRVASEAFRTAADLGCSGDVYDALFALVRREANKVEAALK